jgi:LDH2 family malate/lactate/ureidoglycolate dehydrogenase
MKIKISELQELIEKILSQKHYSAEEATKITEVLLFAELSGKNTQGIMKLLGSEPIHDIEPKYKPKIVRETELSALIDGGRSAGPLAAHIAAEKVIEIATKKGFAMVGLNNTFGSRLA